MRRSAAPLVFGRPGRLAMFVVAEVVLVMAIPFVLIEGYHTLLASRSGNFIAEPTRSDPGWSALVEPSSVAAVAEIDRGRLTGVSLVVVNSGRPADGGVILVPGSVVVDGVALSDRAPTEAVAELGRALRLGWTRVDLLDAEGWGSVLGGAEIRVDNPDPVLDEGDQTVLPVGEVSVGAELAPSLLGSVGAGRSSMSVLPRRVEWWSELLAAPPETTAPLALDLQALAATGPRVVELPVIGADDPVDGRSVDGVVVDPGATEVLIHDLVAYPTGSPAGDRLRLRILDRTGFAQLELLAAELAGRGFEVVEIGNAGVFDTGPTEVIVPAGVTDDGAPTAAQVRELAALAGREELQVDAEAPDLLLVTLVVGGDFDKPSGP